MSELQELIEKAVKEKLDDIGKHREMLVSMFVAQHGWHPDQCQLMVQELGNGSHRTWVEKNGDFEELKRLREGLNEFERLAGVWRERSHRISPLAGGNIERQCADELDNLIKKLRGGA